MGDKNKDCLEKSISIVKNDLDQAGLTINEEKSHLNPSKSCAWLGFIISSETFKFFVPEKKISALKKLLSSFILRQRGSAREISRVASTIISMKPAIHWFDIPDFDEALVLFHKRKTNLGSPA